MTSSCSDKLEGEWVALTDYQRARIMLLIPGENRMGGFGADSGCPGLIERVGINHPIFGSHYRLTPEGIAVRAALAKAQGSQPLSQGSSNVIR